MFSHSTVREGAGPSSRCSRISCFWARTAVLSSIRSSCGTAQPEGEGRTQLTARDGLSRRPPLQRLPDGPIPTGRRVSGRALAGGSPVLGASSAVLCSALLWSEL